MAYAPTGTRQQSVNGKSPRSKFEVQVVDSGVDSGVVQLEISATCYFRSPEQLHALLQHFTDRVVGDIESGDWTGV